MGGYLEIDYMLEDKIENISYYTLQQLEPEAKKQKMRQLYIAYHRKLIILKCMCNNSTTIKMRLNHRDKTDTYYLSSYPEKKELHDRDCHFYNENTLSSQGTINKKSVTEDEEGNYHIALNSHDYKVKDKKTSSKGGLNKTIQEGTNSKGMSSNKLTTQQLIRMIMVEGWNVYSRFKGAKEYPTISLIFNQVYNSTSKKFFIAKNTNVKDVLFNNGKPGRIHFIEKEYRKVTQPFVLFVHKKTDKHNDNKFLIHVTNPVTKDTYQFLAEKELYFSAARAARVSNGRFVVGGFVKSNGVNKPFEFVSLGILPINKSGLPVESSYERQIYDMLCEQNRLFQRPLSSKYHPKWNGLIPDGLLIDTTPYTILEIFGVSESNREYHLHRNYKIEFFIELAPKYDFWYWDAFNKSKVPNFPDNISKRNIK